jgi:ribosomal protein L11 methyltransferase
MTPPIFSEAIADLSHEMGSLGLEIDESSPDLCRIDAYFDNDSWRPALERLEERISMLRQLDDQASQITITRKSVKDEDWALAWREFFEPQFIGSRLLVTPPWLSPPSEGRLKIIIEPAVAFGTGTHETTRACLELLEIAVSHIAGPDMEPHMLDVGCGSGILSIAGAKLGITKVYALDTDPLAIDSTIQNSALNEVSDHIETFQRDLTDFTGRYEIVAANLDPKTLIPNADKLVDLTSIYLIISGSPLDQWDKVKDRFNRTRAYLRQEITGSQWASGIWKRNPDFT